MTMLKAITAAGLVLVAAGGRHRPAREGLPECRGAKGPRPVVLTHLGGCADRPAELLRLDGLGDAGGGWSIAQVARSELDRLRAHGCPTAVLCADGNSYAALLGKLSPAETARKLEIVKAQARPKLREGVDGGPLLPWE
jgi:hypothetical protein